MIYSIDVEFMCYSFRIRSSDIWHVRSVIISIKLSFENLPFIIINIKTNSKKKTSTLQNLWSYFYIITITTSYHYHYHYLHYYYHCYYFDYYDYDCDYNYDYENYYYTVEPR